MNNEHHEQWRARTYGRRGTITEALSFAIQGQRRAKYFREDATKIAQVEADAFGSWLHVSRKHLRAAHAATQRAMQQEANAMLGAALVALVRIQTGAPAR